MTGPRKFGKRKFRPGAVWLVEIPDRPFHFHVLGPAKSGRIDSRLCAVKYVEVRYRVSDFEGDFTIKHLQKYAICIQEGE